MTDQDGKYDGSLTLTHAGVEYTIHPEEVIECQHCGYTWGTQSELQRPCCSECGGHTDRNIKGWRYHEYLKYMLFTGDEETVDEVTEALRNRAGLYEALVANGWRLDCVTQGSDVAFSKGDIEPQNIIR